MQMNVNFFRKCCENAFTLKCSKEFLFSVRYITTTFWKNKQTASHDIFMPIFLKNWGTPVTHLARDGYLQYTYCLLIRDLSY